MRAISKTHAYITYLIEMLAGGRSGHEQSIATNRRIALTGLIDLNSPCLILDLANGRLRPQSYILRKEGHTVIGIDLVNRPETSLTEFAYQLCRRLYCHQIGVSPKMNRQLSLVAGNVSVLPFLSNTFDLVTSFAAFEHFLDVPKVVSEVKRVLKPGGIAWIGIHLFSSFSGGHDIYDGVSSTSLLPIGLRPWGHLSDPDFTPNVPLNRWRAQQYIDCFRQAFPETTSEFKGNDEMSFLTPQIRQRLSSYTEEELTSNLILVARKT